VQPLFFSCRFLAISISSSKSDYRVLFSNINEADGSQIIASLTQMNVPYKFTPGGGAILVPEKWSMKPASS
jgi:flagellar M-ring protein FliF